MTKKIVVAVMLIDEDNGGSPEFYQNTAIDLRHATNPAAIRQVQTWVTEQLVAAKLTDTKLDEG
tara:strand:- start:15213 stop:15404 length:192 start_codon:yes stop_codon:yes gene_type:complete